MLQAGRDILNKCYEPDATFYVNADRLLPKIHVTVIKKNPCCCVCTSTSFVKPKSVRPSVRVSVRPSVHPRPSVLALVHAAVLSNRFAMPRSHLFKRNCVADVSVEARVLRDSGVTAASAMASRRNPKAPDWPFITANAPARQTLAYSYSRVASVRISTDFF